MKSGSWASVGLIYLFGVFGAASLSKVIPLQADLASHLGASAVQFALLISLLTIPAALFATMGGSIVDRIGARVTLIAAALGGALANFVYLQADTILHFEIIRIAEGFVLVAIFSAAPALIMATTSTERRSKAMAFWSTYTPVGVSLGLVLSGGFAGGTHWRGGYALQGGLFLLLALLGLLLPRPTHGKVSAARARGLLSAYTQIGPLRLALTFGVIVIMGFGTNTVFPGWYAREHGVSVGAAASILAVANLSMILGGILTAVLLGNGLSPLRLFVGLAVFGVTASVGIFTPGVHAGLCVAALVVWLVTSGAASAVVSSSLPRVITDPAKGGAAAGLLSQIAALSTFVTPPLWVPVLSAGRWSLFLLIVAACWGAALLLLPVRTPAATAGQGSKAPAPGR